MRQFLWYLIGIILIFVAYQSWANSQDDPETEAMARDAVCAVEKECNLKSTDLASVRTTDPTSRNYQFNTTPKGSFVATCKREYVFVGHWKCTAQGGQIGRR